MTSSIGKMAALRWGVVGTGVISRSVIPDLQAVEGTRVVVVHSRQATKAEAFAKEFGIPRWTDAYDELLASDEIDAVYIATPFAMHHEMVLGALRAGKHVLVEKPMAMNTQEVIELFEVAKANDVFLMEGMWMKFNPVFRSLGERIAGGLIGEVRNVRAAFSMPIPKGHASRWDVGRSGGALLDQGIYPVTLAHALLGEPTAVHAVGTVLDDGLDVAEHFTLDFSGGRFAQCASGMTEFSDLSASVSGTKGWVVIREPFWAATSLEIHAGSAEALFRKPIWVDLPQEGNGYVPMLRGVTDAIRNGLLEHPVHPASQTIAVFRTLDAIRSKAVQGAS